MIAKITLNDKLTRVIASLRFDQGIEINITEHVITRQFSENGFCIDNTYYKLYSTQLGLIKNHYIEDGFGAEIFIVGSNEEDIRKCEEDLINRIKSEVDVQVARAMIFKGSISREKNYISNVDRKHWGEDKGANS